VQVAPEPAWRDDLVVPPPPAHDESWVPRFDITQAARWERGVQEAAGALSRGELVVIPTDTVYGLAADAANPSAVARLGEVKGYDADVEIPVLIGAQEDLEKLGVATSPTVRALAERFWPGPLTLVCRGNHREAGPPLEPAQTVSVRMPDDATTRQLVEAVGPLAVSSAGRRGLPPARSIDEAVALLGESVAVYLDAGALSSPQRSTIIHVAGEGPQLLRRGMVGEDMLREILPGLTLPAWMDGEAR
jgi:L-threonylcarbamoyladenylate synthase